MPEPHGPSEHSPQTRRLKAYLRFVVLYCAVGFVIFQLPTFIPAFGPFARRPGYLTNTAVKMAALLLLSLLAASDPARFRHLTAIFALAYSTCVLTAAAVLIWVVEGGETFVLLGHTLPLGKSLAGVAVMEAAVILGLAWLARAADRAQLGLAYLSPAQFRALGAIADVVVRGRGESVPAEAIARNVDAYLAELKTPSKWLVKVVLLALEWYPLLDLFRLRPRPPLSFMAPDERLDFLRRRFHRAVVTRRLPRHLRKLVQAMIRFAKQLCYLGYYNDPRSYASVGYRPFSERRPGTPRLDSPRLQVDGPLTVAENHLEADIVIVGSGAAASTLAHELARTGRSIVMLERGPHVERKDIVEDEARMLARLYSDGALQLTRDFRFQVLQGRAVGGSTVVNNAVCIDPPDAVLDRWNEELGAGIERSRLGQSVDAVKVLVGVVEQRSHPNPIATAFDTGVRALGLDAHLRPVSANMSGCAGCGYCNIGCAYGAKLSMTERVLPDAQALARSRGGRLRIVADCEVLSLERRQGRVTRARCRLGDREISVAGETFVVAAGALASSLLLGWSRLGGRRVGQRLSFNIGAPVTAVFPTALNAHMGLQISHYLDLGAQRRYLLETWWNPPAAQSLVMPGWFEQHFDNMTRYGRMGAVGVLVGGEASGTLRPWGRRVGLDLAYTPSRGEIETLLDGMALTGQILLAGGATEILPPTFDYVTLGPEQNLLARLREVVRDGSDLNLNSGHPQGGNALSGRDDIGVVRPDFTVRGCANLFLCDASVFPSALGVNPQLTVMALAHYAAPSVAQSLA
jgi:choline dehydrogenase-like flavoprotein